MNIHVEFQVSSTTGEFISAWPLIRLAVVCSEEAYSTPVMSSARECTGLDRVFVGERAVPLYGNVVVVALSGTKGLKDWMVNLNNRPCDPSDVLVRVQPLLKADCTLKMSRDSRICATLDFSMPHDRSSTLWRRTWLSTRTSRRSCSQATPPEPQSRAFCMLMFVRKRHLHWLSSRASFRMYTASCSDARRSPSAHWNNPSEKKIVHPALYFCRFSMMATQSSRRMQHSL